VTIRTAVTGVGSMGWNHARVYNELEGVDLVAVADVDGRMVERATHIYGARGYTDYREMLRHEDLDVVSIAVPTQDSPRDGSGRFATRLSHPGGETHRFHHRGGPGDGGPRCQPGTQARCGPR
jgi:hypothetical protein